MAVEKTLTGMRAKISIFNPNTGKTNIIGIFNSIQFSVQYGVQPIYTLGRHSPAELVYTHAEPVTLTMSAFRTLDHGPYADASIPKLQELLTHEGIQITLIDRAREASGGDGTIGVVLNFKPQGFSQNAAARQPIEFTVTGQGTLFRDETAVDNDEHPTATSLP